MSVLLRTRLSMAQPALTNAIRQYTTGKATMSIHASGMLGSHRILRMTAFRQTVAPSFGTGLYRHMSTETKAAFIDPSVVANAVKDDQMDSTSAVSDSVFPSASQVIENVTEGTVATSTAATQSVLTEVAAQNAETISSMAMKYGDLKAMGLVNFSPVGGLEVLLEAIHVSTGLPWWATIATTTVLIRTMLLPFIVKLQGNTARLHNVKPQLERLTENMKLAKENGDNAAMARFSADTQELFRKNDCNPVKSLMLPLLQAPVMISFYLALRDMAYLPVPQFKEGGVAWFTDLTIADPTYALPVASSLAFLAIMELGSEIGGASQPKGMKNIMRFMAVAMVPLTMNFPSAIFVYWLTSNVYTAGQIMFFRIPTVRRVLSIPELVNHPKPKKVSKQPGFIESFKASYEGGLAAKQKELEVAKEREKVAAQKLRRQNRKRI